jgi:hypothetical protein
MYREHCAMLTWINKGIVSKDYKIALEIVIFFDFRRISRILIA